MFEALRTFADTLQSRSLRVRAFFALLLGALGALSFAPVSLPVFFIVGLAVLALMLRQTPNNKQAFGLAFLYALGLYTCGLYWISASLFIDIQRYWWVLPFSLLALPAWLALLFAIAAWLATKWLRDAPTAHALALAATLFFAEMLRGVLLSGFPWNLAGYIWTGFDAVIQSASLFGIAGLTLLTLLAATSFSLVFEVPRKASITCVALVWIALAGLAVWGQDRIRAIPVTNVANVNLRIVQAAIPQTERRTQDQRVAALNQYIALSNQKGDAKPSLIIWPETASPFFLTTDAPARNVLARIIPKGGALLTGTPSKDGPHYFNSLAVLDYKGDIRGLYDKSHLVPFGEYIPLHKILRTLPIAADVTNAADFSSGAGAKTLRIPGAPNVSPMICYEAIFGGSIVNETDKPGWLLQVTNDAWFGNTSGPYQHFAMARVRAIEQGVGLVRAANSGISAIVDPLGRIIKSLPLDARGIIDGPLPAALENVTPYSQFNDLPALIAAALLLAAVIAYTFMHNRP